MAKKLSLPELKAYVANVVTLAGISNDSFVETRNNTVGLLDKIGKIVFNDSIFTIDKLARFDGEFLETGKTIEEYFEDLILPQDYDPTGANNMAPNDPTYRPVFYSYTVGRKYIPTTIRNDDVERAVNNLDEFTRIISVKAKRLDDSNAQYRYAVKREMIARYIELAEDEMGLNTAPATFDPTQAYATINTLLKDNNNTPTAWGILVKAYSANDATDWDDAVEQGFIIVLDLITEIAIPTDTSTSNAFIKQVKKDVEIASDISEGHSLNGNTLGAIEGIVLAVKQGVMPTVDVEALAGAFHQEQLAIPADVIVVKDFGDADDDYFAVLMDQRGMRLHNTYNATREDFNGKGDFLNLYRHTEDTAYISRNTYFKAYKKP